ncbi:MAG: hypothetical protein KatS3mg031_0086 [Chitinophagales bacterium]|nr:MAG: hypothetical protein KatS3mg031_0086 [Chitinophagales bacterium]
MQTRRIFFLLACCPILTFSQANRLNMASIALDKKHYENAWRFADEALQQPDNLSPQQQLQARLIRGIASYQVAFDALRKDDENLQKQYLSTPRMAYDDLTYVLANGDSSQRAAATEHLFQLGHALFLAGTLYDLEFINTGDSSLIEQAVACYTANIDLWERIGRQKYRPYLHRGDNFLTKKDFEPAIADLQKAFELYSKSEFKYPDFNIGDLGYRLAYTLAGVYKQKETALNIINQTRQHLDNMLQLTEEKKDKLGEERYSKYNEEYKVLNTELDKLEKSIREAP